MGKSKRSGGSRWVVAAAAMAGLMAFAPATSPASLSVTVVNDTWLDGTDSDPAAPQYSEYATDSDADNNIESVWYQGGVGTLDPTGAGGPLRGDLTAGGTQSGTWTTYFTPEATPVTLAQGDTLKVTWKFKPTGTNATNTSQNFRVALMDSPAAQRISANGSPASGAYTGYSMFMNMGQTLGNSSPFQLRERVVASGDTLSTSGNWGANGVANTGLGNGATSGTHGYDDGTEYTLVMMLTRNVTDGLDIASTMSGGTLNGTGTASVNITDPSPNGFTFDMFQVRPSSATGTAQIFDTTLFQVEAPIPEPASAALLAAPAVAMMLRRRRLQTTR
jgi:hypothetical protein